MSMVAASAVSEGVLVSASTSRDTCEYMKWSWNQACLSVFLFLRVRPGESHQLPERQWGLRVSRSETHMYVCVSLRVRSWLVAAVGPEQSQPAQRGG